MDEQIKLLLSKEDVEQIMDSLYYHYECADNQEWHENNKRIIKEILKQTEEQFK